MSRNSTMLWIAVLVASVMILPKLVGSAPPLVLFDTWARSFIAALGALCLYRYNVSRKEG